VRTLRDTLTASVVALVGITTALAQAPPAGGAAAKERAHRQYVIRVQPVVARDDAGRGPASMALPQDLIEQAYAPADVGFFLFEPIYLDSTKARDGTINLDRIVDLAKSKRLLKGPGDVVNLIFVNAVDGKKGPLGRGMQGGNVTFVVLGDEGQTNRALQGFVIAHEIAHNLGLPHAVNDPTVEVKTPNLLGDGPFEERIGARSLVPSQVERIHRSPLVRPWVDFLSIEQGRATFLDDSFDTFLSGLTALEVAAFTGKEVSVPSAAAVRAEAATRFGDAIMELSGEEREALTWTVGELERNLGTLGLAGFARCPWRFVKTQSWLCGGMSYTRGTAIVLSQRVLESIVERWRTARQSGDPKETMRAQGLLLHEQTHVLQRLFPRRFGALYEQWGFVRGVVRSDAAIEASKVTNPDAPLASWLIPAEEKGAYHWARVQLRPGRSVPKLGEDFVETAYMVKKRDDAFVLERDRSGSPRSLPLAELTTYTRRFPVTTGIDHPNEIAAYMLVDYYREAIFAIVPRSPLTAEQTAVRELFRAWTRAQSW
jgi:hypothetical protein